LRTITVYEISAEELEQLSPGSGPEIALNVALTCLSSAISFTASLALSTISDMRVFVVLTVITVVGYAAGIILLVFWWQQSRSTTSVVERIRRRLPPEGDLLSPTGVEC